MLMSDERTAWVVPQASPSKSTYHTDPDCFNVTDRHVEKSLAFVKRSRLSECSFCAGTSASAHAGNTQESPAREIRKRHD